MTPTENTERGFRIYARIECRDGVTLRVQESSLAFEGAHLWLFVDGECVDHHGSHTRPVPHLNVAQAKELITAISQWVHDAEAGVLVEPPNAEDWS